MFKVKLKYGSDTGVREIKEVNASNYEENDGVTSFYTEGNNKKSYVYRVVTDQVESIE